MGVINTANARQSHKHKLSYATYRDRGLRDVNKAKRAIRTYRDQPNNDVNSEALRALYKRAPHLVDLAMKQLRREWTANTPTLDRVAEWLKR